MTHAKCGLLAYADMISTCLQRMSCNGVIDQLIPFLLRLMRVISQLTMINDKTLIAVLAAIHLLSAVGLAGFDQDRMMVLCQEKVQIKYALLMLSYPAKASALSSNAA